MPHVALRLFLASIRAADFPGCCLEARRAFFVPPFAAACVRCAVIPAMWCVALDARRAFDACVSCGSAAVFVSARFVGLHGMIV